MTNVARPRVLIVDDDPALLDALSEAIGLRIPTLLTETCEGGVRALERVRSGEYDAIISDIKMPGMDGIELLRRIKELAPETPTLLMTGHGQTDLAIQALRAGAFDLIQKPLDRDYFIAALARALETRRLKKEISAQQASLLDYAQNLEQRVQERTSDLEKALQAKDEFLGLVSHELRNPMTVIMGNAEALYRYDDALTAEERKGALTDLRLGTKRLMQLIENLLVLAKAEYGIQEMEPVLIDRLIDKEVSWYQQFSSHRTIRVELPTPPPPPIICNATHVEIVLKNLIGNADKYSPPEQPIEVIAHEGDAEFVITVRDRGPGIAPAERDLVFQPFYRSKTTADVNGMGIGLAVCKKLVELNGGRVWLSCLPEGGSEFSFSLPLSVQLGAGEEDGIPAVVR